jgi:hypothetical protein
LKEYNSTKPKIPITVIIDEKKNHLKYFQKCSTSSDELWLTFGASHVSKKTLSSIEDATGSHVLKSISLIFG